MALSDLAQHTPLHAAKRGGELIASLMRFGFDEVVSQSGLRQYLPKRSSSGSEPAPVDSPAPVRLRLLLEELGPTFIKAGQILANRPDLVPPEWTVELKKLQADVPPAPWAGDDPQRHAEAALRAELGDRVDQAFSHIDPEPLAAASMAQVHPATLCDGTEVVLKILRPGIHQTIRGDLQLMRWTARLADAYLNNLGFDALDVVEEFSRQLEREADLRVEAESTQRMAHDFDENQGIEFPHVYEDLSTRGVLTLQRVRGRLLADLEPSQLPMQVRRQMVANAADAVFRQCLDLGFFHADPHAGNIFVDPDSGHLTFIDCGMTGSIDPRSARQLALITHGTIEGELDRVLRVTIRIGDADPAIVDDRAFRADVWRFIDNFKSGTLESIHVGELLEEFFAVLRKYHLRCPADIVYLIKALTTIEGVANEFAPEFDLVGHVRPYVSRLIHQRFSLEAIKDRLVQNAVAYTELIDDLPHGIDDLLRMVRQGRTRLHLDIDNLDQLSREVDEASRTVSWAVMIGAIIVGGAVLVLADSMDRDQSHMTTIATVVVAIAAVAGVVRLVWPHKDY